MSDPSYGHVAAAARGWWRDLQPTETQKGDRAALARLRRSASPRDAMVEPATLALFRRLGLNSPRKLPKAAVIAMTLAHVREDEAPGEEKKRRHPIRRVGRPTMENEDDAIMKPIRFRRLLACRDDDDQALDELAREMRRFVALAGKKLDVGELAASLFFWNDRTRARWAFEYFAAGQAAPRTDAAA